MTGKSNFCSTLGLVRALRDGIFSDLSRMMPAGMTTYLDDYCDRLRNTLSTLAICADSQPRHIHDQALLYELGRLQRKATKNLNRLRKLTFELRDGCPSDRVIRGISLQLALLSLISCVCSSILSTLMDARRPSLN